MNKQQTILLFFTTFFVFTLFAQNTKSGSIKYKFIKNIVSNEDRAKYKELHGFLDLMNEASENLEFILFFNSNESLFFLEESMESDIKPMGISFAKNIISKGKYYYNKEKDSLLRESSFYDDNILIYIKPSEREWKLTNESKYIGNFKCYKATTLKTIKSDKKLSKILIVAWYSPEIPFSYGPNEFNGLPGLILELKDVNYTFYVKEIKLNKNVKILPLKSKKIIAQEKYFKNVSSKSN